MERQYYLNGPQGQIGPISLADIRATRPQGVTHVWYAGALDWMPLDQVPEVKEALASAQAAPPPPPAQGAAPGPAPSAPSRDGPMAATAVSYRHGPELANEIDRLYRRMGTWLTLTIVIFFVALVLFIVAMASDEEETGAAIGILGLFLFLACLITFTVHWCMLHYRYWLVVCERTGFNEHTPGMAVGLLFVPLFSLYWMFPSYQKLSELINQVLDRDHYQGRGPRVNTGTATALCVLNIVAIIPYFGLLVSIVKIFVWYNVYGQNRRAITWILRADAASTTFAK